MRFPSQFGFALGGSAALAVLAGCSGGGGAAPAASSAIARTSIRSATAMSVARGSHGRYSVVRPDIRELHPEARPGPFDLETDPAKTAAAIFVSDASVDTVRIFNAAGKLTKTLAGFTSPQGLATDAAGNLYIADTGDERIVVYAKGYAHSHLLADAAQYPAGVAVDSAGVVAVTNVISSGGGAGSVSIYEKGATSPSYTIPGGAFARVYFDAFDKAGNLFIDGSNASGTVLVGEIVKGNRFITPLATSNTIGFPGGVQVDTNDEVVIDDQSGLAVYTYSLKGSKLTLTTTTPLSGASDPVGIALTSTDKHLWTADAGLATSQEFAFSRGGSPITSLTGFSQPIGVALTPVEKP